MAKLLHRFLPASLRRRAALWPHRQATARLEGARRAPQDAQRRALTELLQHNAHTEFGRTHGFARISGLSDYAGRVPLRGYHELEPYLRREVDGEPDVLLAGPLLGFALDEVNGRRRLLPLSDAGRAHRRWVGELLQREALMARPEIAGLPWLRLLPRHTSAEVEQDAARTPTLPLQLLLQAGERRSAGALPAALFTLDDEALRYYTLLRLAIHQRYGALQAENPGTLTIFAEHLELAADELLDELSSGAFSRRDALPETLRAQLPQRFSPQPKQAARLRELRKAHGRLEPAHLWPELGALLCDTGGVARGAARRLPDRFGNVAVIDSGHATAEAVLTLPSSSDEGALALLEGQLLEFLPANQEPDGDVPGPTLPADGLRLGQRYLPIVSNHHGLYRYALDQLVEVSEIDGGTPRLARVGRRAQRLALGAGSLDEQLLRDAVLAACRHCDLVLVGASAWLQPATTTQEDAGSSARPSFWQRLLGRGKEESTDRRRRPALAWAVELGETLDTDRAKKLSKALEGELTRSCEPYARLRSEKALDAGSLLLLRSGTFSRHARRALANGLPSGHLPPPALRETPWPLADDELERTID